MDLAALFQLLIPVAGLIAIGFAGYLARDVLRHRIVLSYEALAEDMSADDLLTPILAATPLPQIPLRERSAHAVSPGDSPWTRPPR